MKITPNIQKFLDTIDHARKYLAICDPCLIDQYNDLRAVYDDDRLDFADNQEEEIEQLKKYRYHCMVLDLLKERKYKKELLETYGLKFIMHQEEFEDASGEYTESSNDIIQFRKLYF